MSKVKKSVGEEQLESLKNRLSETRKANLENLSNLLEKTAKNLRENGVHVHIVSNNADAFRKLVELTKDDKLAVKSKSNTVARVLGSADTNQEKKSVSDKVTNSQEDNKSCVETSKKSEIESENRGEIFETEKPQEIGIKLAPELVETDTGDFVARMVKRKDAHPVLPAATLPSEEIAKALSRKLGKKIPPKPTEIVSAVKAEVRKALLSATVGITGANAISSDGTIMILENEGNIGMVSRLPDKHIVVAGIEKLVASQTEALMVAKASAHWATGQKNPSYINMISAPSKTADIENKIIEGAQGPSELHLVLIDNRDEIPDKFKSIMRCINCGACLSVCDAYLASSKGEKNKQYTGIKALAEDMIHNIETPRADLLYRCTTCKACENICPVKIPLRDVMLELRQIAVENGESPGDLAEMIQNIRKTGNPFGRKRRLTDKLYCC